MGEPSDWKSQTTNSITTDREKNNYSFKTKVLFCYMEQLFVYY